METSPWADGCRGERAMAEQLHVSRTSVREAVRILEAMGVVRAGVGSGKDAGTVVIAEPGSALGSTLRLHVATRHLPVADIVETRVLLESWAAERAHVGVPELEEAAELLDQMDAPRTLIHSWPLTRVFTWRSHRPRATQWSVP